MVDVRRALRFWLVSVLVSLLLAGCGTSAIPAPPATPSTSSAGDDYCEQAEAGARVWGALADGSGYVVTAGAAGAFASDLAKAGVVPTAAIAGGALLVGAFHVAADRVLKGYAADVAARGCVPQGIRAR